MSTECSLYIPNISNFLTGIEKYSKKRIFFITVKDNSLTTRWSKIGKVNDWIKRYSKCFYIVKGTSHGTHFHILAGLEPDKNLKFVRGIHFHIRPLGDINEIFPVDYTELSQSKEKSIFYAEKKIQRVLNFLGEAKIKILKHICKIVKDYFKKKATKIKNTLLRKLKCQNLQNVVNYMLTNLNEPRENLHERYIDYISIPL